MYYRYVLNVHYVDPSLSELLSHLSVIPSILLVPDASFFRVFSGGVGCFVWISYVRDLAFLPADCNIHCSDQRLDESRSLSDRFLHN